MILYQSLSKIFLWIYTKLFHNLHEEAKDLELLKQNKKMLLKE